jgi:tRNA G18 (ribose-2'-O)-methylase SpoU
VGVASVRFDTYLSIYTKGLEWSFYFRAPPPVVRVVSAAVDLIADGIENPHNVRALIAAAAMFDAGCWFRQPKTDVAEARCGDDLDDYDFIVGLENLPKAESIYNFRSPPTVTRIALVVGNERFGIRRELLARCHRFVQIPMASRKVNTLNVAAAAAVGLRYICNPPQRAARRVWKKRPQILFDAPKSAAEFGSALRSAAAFGWTEVFLNDVHGVWFDATRANRAEARAAGRMMKNSLRVHPARLVSARDETVVIADDAHNLLRLHASITLAEIARLLRT